MTLTYLTLNEKDFLLPPIFSLSFMVQCWVFLLDNLTIAQIFILQKVKVNYSLPQKFKAVHVCWLDCIGNEDLMLTFFIVEFWKKQNVWFEKCIPDKLFVLLKVSKKCLIMKWIFREAIIWTLWMFYWE